MRIPLSRIGPSFSTKHLRNMGVHGGDILRRRRLAGADSPNRLIGDGCVGAVRSQGNAALDLGVADMGSMAGIALLLRLAHADDGDKAGAPGGRRLGRDHGIAFSMELAALGMAHNHRRGATVLQHLGRNVAGKGPAFFGVAVLPAQRESAFDRRQRQPPGSKGSPADKSSRRRTSRRRFPLSRPPARPGRRRARSSSSFRPPIDAQNPPIWSSAPWRPGNAGLPYKLPPYHPPPFFGKRSTGQENVMPDRAERFYQFGRAAKISSVKSKATEFDDDSMDAPAFQILGGDPCSWRAVALSFVVLGQLPTSSPARPPTNRIATDGFDPDHDASTSSSNYYRNYLRVSVAADGHRDHARHGAEDGPGRRRLAPAPEPDRDARTMKRRAMHLTVSDAALASECRATCPRPSRAPPASFDHNTVPARDPKRRLYRSRSFLDENPARRDDAQPADAAAARVQGFALPDDCMRDKALYLFYTERRAVGLCGGDARCGGTHRRTPSDAGAGFAYRQSPCRPVFHARRYRDIVTYVPKSGRRIWRRGQFNADRGPDRPGL